MPGQTGLSKLIAEGSAGAASGRAQRPLGREAVDLLAEIPLFASLSRRHLGKIAGAATAKRYAPHSVLVLKGKPADAFYVILDGESASRCPVARSSSARATSSARWR